jgi:hypothetical protein
MRETRARHVTGAGRAIADKSAARSRRRRGNEPQETRVFIWNDLDTLFQYLHKLAQNPESGFSSADLLRVMAFARWQARSTEF